ncbi:MAG: PHP domain-containing protein [Bacteroidetes bacterium]|nr:PHP domain-containing protein [Bacteroidota bacterium]
MSKIDLHVHSKYSDDGEFGIQDIINKCTNNKIKILSITDHNSVRGVDEAISISSQSGIELISGIEIDCNYNNIDLHLLGYNIDWNSSDFIDLEKDIKKKVMESFPEMIKNLDNLGIKVNANEVLEKAKEKLPCGELIAEVLLTNKDYHSNKKLQPYMKGGERSDMPYINFYHDFFAQGKPAYVKINYMSYHDAIDLVSSNGGIAIIGHPGVNLKGKEEIIIELLNSRAKGIEVFNNYHDSRQIDFFAELAIQRNILMTCGSDFHGKNKPLIDIGKYRINKKYQDYLLRSIKRISE